VTKTWKVRADTGGTFTDAWALTPAGEERRCKVLSDGSLVARIQSRAPDGWVELGWSPAFEDAVFPGMPLEVGGKILAAREQGRWLKISGTLTGDRIVIRTGEEAPVLAARFLTGTPFPQKLPVMDFRVATTRGTNALLERKGAATVLFVTRGFGDLLEIRDQRRAALFSLRQPDQEILCKGTVEISGRLDAGGSIIEAPNEMEVRCAAREWLARGVEVAAVALLHAWLHPHFETQVADWLREEGFRHVTTSSGVAPVIRFLPRLETAVADAWLAPILRHFTTMISGAMQSGEPWMMTSAGGLVTASRYQPKDSLLSGPAGGLVGAAAIARAAGFPKVLTFDMGGTSTDVARIDGPFSYRYEQEIGPARVLAPALKIETVAAGGGSICCWHLGRLRVGPESAGSIPGPACYGRGGPLTVTDVNLLLGLMHAEGAGIPLHEDAARAALALLMQQMTADGAPPESEHALLLGLREIAVEKMADAIRGVSLAEGHRAEDFALFAFGGAGPQHACAVAELLGIRDVIIPGDAGLLSAWGLDQARRQEQAARQILRPLADVETSVIWNELAEQSSLTLDLPNPSLRWLIGLRLIGQDTTLEIECGTPDDSLDDLKNSFAQAYQQLYGYLPTASREIECVTLRVIAEEPARIAGSETFGDVVSTGPQIMQDRFSTCVLPVGWEMRKGSSGTLLLHFTEENFQQKTTEGEIRAALFRSRFEGLVGEMGSILQRTALSANVRERLDYSCALLDESGNLVVNAPHVPVHLGALGLCVREVMARMELQPGDVVVTNHPAAGGSHLPDVTVIAAVFDRHGKRIGYVANRAHHAEIGGMAPGSMPAAARCLAEEGVVISPFKWVEAGVRRDDLLVRLLENPPYPSRRPAENLADLEAQLASVAHGVETLHDLSMTHGEEIIRSEMSGILSRSAALMRSLLSSHEGVDLFREETLDDGTPLSVSIRVRNGRLTLDFQGSGPVHPRNLNATPAIVRSVVLYVLRLWLNEDVPLNEGLLQDVEILIPRSFLNPEFQENPLLCPAVVGGNVETSQRLTDLLLATLDLCSHGPGTMNNFLFGNDSFGYYETIAGGAGAGETFDGQSSRHVHMTNTAITDPEVLEHRFPVRLHRFERRRGSGGTGRHHGGDGVIREIEFLQPMTVSFLTERRHTSPQGMHGGGHGSSGRQTRVTVAGESESLPGAVTYQAEAGEKVIIETPGGGGWG